VLPGFGLALGFTLVDLTLVVLVALLIVTRLEQYDYAGATAIAAVTLVASFVLLLTINRLQSWSARLGAGEQG
jgi:sulfate transport system permease protein